jgi:N-acetylmuramoyl-L-alanine amidase
MIMHGRSSIAAFMACLFLLVFTAPAFPSYNSEAGRKYTVACQRLADLRKSNKKKKYRSYWIDCIRTFELVEKKYPKSPNAADACFDRASLYFELFQFNKYSRDLDESLSVYGKCQASYQDHGKAPEALYRVVDFSVEYKRKKSEATKAYAKLAASYPDSPWLDRAKSRLGISAGNLKKDPEPQKKPAHPPSQEKAGPPSVIKSIRHWSGGAYTRIVIDQDKPVKFQAQELNNPDRLVFDLLNAHVHDSVNKDPLPVNDGLLKQVRASQYTPDTVRVVLDLASIKSYAAFPLHDPERLVIDITGETGETTVAAAGGADAGDRQKPDNADAEESGRESDHKQNGTDPKISAPPLKFSPPGQSDKESLSLSRQLGLKIRTIAIDAGHGGHDPGAMGKNGLKEKNITLDIAKRLALLVKDRLGCNIVMTRDKDVFIPLEQRPFIAKSRNADLFVSIHVNATRKRTTRGIETYIQGLRASDRDAMATAARENATTSKTLNELDDELSKILKGLRVESNDEDSIQLAHAVQGALVNNLKPLNNHAADLKTKVKRAFFYVLINTEMPSILAEVGFISNPDEEKLLRKESYRQSIAEALYQGVKKYVDSRSPQMMGI